MISHNVKLEGIEFEVFGIWEESDETTGYSGGWSTFKVLINNDTVCGMWMLNDWALNKLSEIVVEENY